MKSTFLTVASCVGAQDVFLANTVRVATKADLVRARTTEQSGRLAGSSPREIADKINGHFSNSGFPTKPCNAYTLAELNNIIREMVPLLNDDLASSYAAGDGRMRRFNTLAEYEQSWEADSDHDHQTIREAKCAETLMLWAHHLSEGGKNVFGKRELPTLPAYDEEKSSSDVYAKALTCQSGHAMKKGGDGASTHQWPDWPEELHYKAMGHGAYPFWWITSQAHENDAAPMEVWWSEKQGVEKFYHSSCAGAYDWLQAPCYHMMFAPDSSGEYAAYLYNEEAEQGKSYADGARCCFSSPSSSGSGGLAEPLAPSQGTFWNTFTYEGERDFNGVYYQGQAKYYVMTGVNEPVRQFWYFTDLDGKPVQQGEAGTGPTDQGFPTSIGHTIWHDYDPSTLDSSPIDASVFTVPAYCKEATQTCAFP